MKRTLPFVMAFALAGCNQCSKGPVPSEGAGVETSPDSEAEGTPSAPKPATIYREAYERARQEITIANARAKLRELERAIEKP